MNKTTVGTSAGAVAVLVFALRFANVPQREKLGDARPEAAAAAPNATTAEPAEKTPPLEGPWLATRPFFHKEGIPQVQFANGEKVTLSHIRDLERCAHVLRPPVPFTLKTGKPCLRSKFREKAVVVMAPPVGHET